MSSGKVQQIVGALLSYVALGLVAAAQATTAWLVVLGSETGLYQQCFSFGGCRDLGWNPDGILSVFVTRIILLLADLFILVALICGLSAFCASDNSRKSLLIASGALNITSGALVLVGNIAFTVLMITLTLVNLTLTYTFGFCFSFCWAAGVLFIVAGILQIVSSKSDPIPIQPVQAGSVWSTTTHYNPTMAGVPQQPHYQPPPTDYPKY